MISDLAGCTRGRVVADVNVLAKAGAEWIAAGGVWPLVPPDLRPINAAAVSLFADADLWELWISPALRRLTREVLLGNIGEEFSLPVADVDAYLDELDRVVAGSGGESVRPRMRMTDFIGDQEDDRNVASLAASIQADVVISWDKEVHKMGVRDLPSEGGGTKEVRFVTCGDFVQHVHNIRTAEGGWWSASGRRTRPARGQDQQHRRRRPRGCPRAGSPTCTSCLCYWARSLPQPPSSLAADPPGGGRTVPSRPGSRAPTSSEPSRLCRHV